MNQSKSRKKAFQALYALLCDLANILHSTGGPAAGPTPDFNLRDSDGRSVLALAVWSGFYKVAAQLLNSGADINYKLVDYANIHLTYYWVKR